MITVSISGRKATLLKTEDLPTGNDLSIKVNLKFNDSDPIWKNTRKIAVFYAVTPKGLKKRLPAVITENDECYIPGKIISTPYSKVEIGVTAVHEDGSSISTNNVFLNKTKPGAGGDCEFDYDEQPVNKSDFDEFLSNLAASVDSKIMDLQSFLMNSKFVTASDLPKNISQLKNDKGYITKDDLPADELPTVTESDNGKVLRVVDGVWAAATIPKAEGVGF